MTIGAILKPSGSTVKVDEEILELETDKLNQALYAPAGGQIQLTVKMGDVVKIGQTIGTIASSGAEVSAPEEREVPPASIEKKIGNGHGLGHEERSNAPPLPAARKKMDEAISEITQSPEVVLPRYSQNTTTEINTTEKKGETRKKMTKLRRVIAERLVQVKNQTAMLTTFNEVDLSHIIAVREQEQENFQKKHGVKLGFMSFFIKAAIAALQEFPECNARIDGDEIVTHSFFNISCAVSTDRGLMVPVIRSAERLSYAEVEKKLKELAEKARSGTISVDDLQGGTFTITNAGLFGSLLSTPILNPPQAPF